MHARAFQRQRQRKQQPAQRWEPHSTSASQWGGPARRTWSHGRAATDLSGSSRRTARTVPAAGPADSPGRKLRTAGG